MKNELEKILREALGEVNSQIDVNSIPVDANLEDYGYDSIAIMEYMLLIEEKLDIIFDENLAIEDLQVLSKLIKVIEEDYNDSI